MIIVDRQLSDDEKESFDTSKPHIDLTKSTYTQDIFKNELFDWIDHSDSLLLNEEPVANFFSISNRSYWFHVRARMFFELFSHAQLLDRIEDLDILEKATIIYCNQVQASFWSLWAPHAQLITKGRDVKKQFRLSEFLRRGVQAVRKIPSAYSLIKKSYTGLIYSPMRNALQKGNVAIDRKLESIFEHSDDDLLRIEYQMLPVLPPGDWLESFKVKRSQPTLFTDSLLLLFVIRHPLILISLFRLFPSLKKKKTTISTSYNFSFKKGNWDLLIEKQVRASLNSLLQMILFENAFWWLLTLTTPKYILASGENNSIGRTFIDSGKRKSIRTFGMQHGLLVPHNIDYRFNAKESINAYPDHFFAWGEASKKFAVNIGGQPEEKITVVGQSEFDQIEPELSPSKKASNFKQKRNKKVLFFASQQQQNQQSRIECARELASFCKSNNLCCLVKWHPNEKRDDIHRHFFIAEGIEDDIDYIEDHIYPIMSASDFVSTCFSTVAWEAMTIKKPLIIIDPLELNLLKFKNLECIYYQGARQTNTLEEWLLEIDNHTEEAQKLAEYEFGPRDGLSYTRILGKIEEIMDH